MDNFQKDNPDIKVKVVRESTGTMAAKMMAEKDNPQADVLFETFVFFAPERGLNQRTLADIFTFIKMKLID